jgi:hypothetical protein
VWAEQTFRIEPLVFTEDVIYYLTYIWAVWLGIVIWRRVETREQMVEAAAVA